MRNYYNETATVVLKLSFRFHIFVTLILGELTTTNYPESYLPNLLCEWEIVAPIGSRIRVEFKEFETEDNPECKFDSLHIMDSMMERTFCGKRLPNPVFSSSNYLHLKFTSDAHGQFRGIRAVYSFVSDHALNEKCQNDKHGDLKSKLEHVEFFNFCFCKQIAVIKYVTNPFMQCGNLVSVKLFRHVMTLIRATAIKSTAVPAALVHPNGTLCGTVNASPSNNVPRVNNSTGIDQQ